MNYQSTRKNAAPVSACAAILQGIAPDGGLYVPQSMDSIEFDWRAAVRERSVYKLASSVLCALLPDIADMDALVRRAYEGKFDTEELTPLVAVGENYVLELFHGPTSAFKDVALSMLPQLITSARAQQGVREETVILTATSGDTGKAAMAGFRDVEGTRIIVFYPEQGVSPVQKAQMVTQEGDNVCVCAVRGNFDDAQQGVKSVFSTCADGRLAQYGAALSSANSINIGRLAPQVVYYFKAYGDLLRRGAISLGDAVDFCVPTGNFGDILAGWFAMKMGLPVGKLVCASNANAVLADFLKDGVYDRNRPFHKTVSPSMDILISSNLERLLYLCGGGDEVAQWMEQLRATGRYQVSAEVFGEIRRVFCGGSCDDTQTKQTIREVWEKHGYLCDTHTAVAWRVASQYKTRRPMVVLSTASPFKFPAAVLEAIGEDLSGDEFAQMERLSCVAKCEIPAGLRGLREKKVLHREVIDREDMLAFVEGKVARNG